MLRMFKVTSPMSVGTWILTFSGLASGLADRPRGLRRLPRASGPPRRRPGARSVPVDLHRGADGRHGCSRLARGRRELPFVFAGSSAASAGAAAP